MLYSHIISDLVTITKYKGTEPFRLAPDYTLDSNVDINSANNAFLVNNDLVLLTHQTNVTENGLYIFSNGFLNRYYQEFFDKIDKIYAIDPNNSSSYIGFFGPTANLNQLKRIEPNQGIIIFHKSSAQLPYKWYDIDIRSKPSLVIDKEITQSNISNLGFAGSNNVYAMNLNYKDYRPFPITLKISGATDLATYKVMLDLVSCPDPEYIRVLDKITLSKTSISLSGSNKTLVVNNNTLNSQFSSSLQNGSIVWLVNSNYTIDGLYEHDGYGTFTALPDSDYILRTRKYIIDDAEFDIRSISNDWYVNRTLYISYPGHYDLYVKLVDPSNNTILSEDHMCFDIDNIINMPTPTPTVTPTPPRHSVSFDDGPTLKIQNCESCVKVFVGATANNLNIGDNYYYEFSVFEKGESLPRDTDNETGTLFEPGSGYLSTGYSTQKFGTYISVSDKVRTIIEVRLINLTTGVVSSSYLTLAVCDENYCDPPVTPTPTSTPVRVNYPPRPTPSVTSTITSTPTTTPTPTISKI